MDLVIGMDIIDMLGGVTITRAGVVFGSSQVSEFAHVALESPALYNHADSSDSNIIIDDKDFRAVFDGKKWVVKWFWVNDKPPKLKNKISTYNSSLTDEKVDKYETEIERWIKEGILEPWEGEVSEGIIPLLAVDQPTKDKVRPVLDFRELNTYVKCHTGDEIIDVCGDKLREWRKLGDRASLVDLKSAYLQLNVNRELWKYQLIKYKDKVYCLTRLGFGLNCAPRIMTKILKTVLGTNDKIANGTDSYIDDIIVDESKVSAHDVIEHLSKYGLEAKPSQYLCDCSVLGLKLKHNGSELVFTRSNNIPDIPDKLTRRDLFSVCGKLTGHYPIAGWLRLACSYIKRHSAGINWDDFVGYPTLFLLREVVGKVKHEDPVSGCWKVEKSDSCEVWCDASSLALGVLLEVNGRTVEDAAWLRKKEDCNHINVSELEAVLKGVNMALKWDFNVVKVMTDSAAVYNWVMSVITEEKRVHTKGAAEMIIKRRLGTLKSLIEEFDIDISVVLVPTAKNKADVLTRIRKSWLLKGSGKEVCLMSLAQVHGMHHLGVDRTLYLARRQDPTVKREDVRRIVTSCEQCQLIDPAPAKHEPGQLNMPGNWKRLAIDVTHYRQLPYLSMVDCGPGRFAIWKKLRNETGDEMAAVLDELFLERGPVEEVLMDNGMAFRSQQFCLLL